MTDFFDRETEQKELRNILGASPSLVYFVFGPINSGKTSLITQVLDDLPSDAIAFYINFRRRNVSSTGDFFNVLFEVDQKSRVATAREYMGEFFKAGSGVAGKYTGIPVPARLFDLFFGSEDKGADVFRYLETFFVSLMKEKNLRPVLVLDELQVIRHMANSASNPLLEKLFNFMVSMTKETRTAHCMAATSDSLFLESIHGAAQLQGRSQYMLVDDLDRERAFEVYESFGYGEKETVWDYIGGKLGDMTMLEAWLNRGYGLKESLDRMLQAEIQRLRMLLRKWDDAGRETNLLERFKSNDSVEFAAMESQADARFWIDENVLFLDFPAGILRPQGRLMHKAIQSA